MVDQCGRAQDRAGRGARGQDSTLRFYQHLQQLRRGQARRAARPKNSPLNPLSDYARAKVECEKLVLAAPLAAGRHGAAFGTICGLSGRMRFDLLVSEMAKKCARGEKIDIFAPMPGGRSCISSMRHARSSCILKSSSNRYGATHVQRRRRELSKAGLGGAGASPFPGGRNRQSPTKTPTCAITASTARGSRANWASSRLFDRGRVLRNRTRGQRRRVPRSGLAAAIRPSRLIPRPFVRKALTGIAALKDYLR